MDDIEMLLEQVKMILDIRRKTHASTGKGFTVFSAMGMETDEVNTHCRLLYEVLRPDGGHGMNDAFLREFFTLVLNKPFPKGVSVRREYSISGHDDELYGRIDLLIEGQGVCYPIEVKIYAGDQYRQIARYDEFAKARAKENRVYYLTLDGHEPSEDSTGGNPEFAECLSFSEDIRQWLLRCAELAWQKPDVVAAIRQYITLINKLTEAEQGDVYMDAIKNVIEMSQENYESAAAVEKALLQLRIEKMRQIFEGIEAHIGGAMKLAAKDYADFSRRYYESPHRSTFPSLTYEVARLDDLIISLNFEIDWRLCYGVIAYRDGFVPVPQEYGRLISVFEYEKWEKLLASNRRKDCWLWWRYLPDFERKMDFRNCSEGYPNLYDKQGNKLIMQAIYDEIDENLDSIMKTGLPRDADKIWTEDI